MKKVLFFLTLLLVFPITANATINSSAIACTTNKLTAGSAFSCSVTIVPNSDTPITSFMSNVIYPSTDMTLTSITPASSWISNSNSLLNLTNDSYDEGEGLTTSLNIATLNFKVKESPSYGEKIIKINGYDLTSESTEKVRIYSTNNLLSKLTIAGIDFAFSPNQKTYNLNTTKSVISINAETYDSRATFVEGYGPRNVNLNYGTNNVQVIVQSENGSNNVYTLNITRVDQRGTNNSLSLLSISNGSISPSFNKNTLNYSATVDSSVTSVNVMATLDSTSASFVANYGPRTVSLQNGMNSIEIQVKAENETLKTYNINIIKIEKNVNNYLNSIKLSNASLSFDKNTLTYNVNVLYNIMEMDVVAEPEDTTSTVEVIGNKSLIVGANTYTINVKSESGAILTYKVIVNRLEEGRKLSSNNYLKELLLSNYPIDFNKETLNYTIKIEQEDRLTISFTPEDENAKVEISGNNALKNGSVIKIKVTSEDSKVRVYNINIEKDANFSGIIPYIAAFLAIAIIVLLLIFKDKIFKPKDNQIISGDLKLGSSKLVLKTSSKKDVVKTDKKNLNPEQKPEVVVIPDVDIKDKK